MSENRRPANDNNRPIAWHIALINKVSNHDIKLANTVKLPLIGIFRTYWLATVICAASLVQGYDSGVAGGVLTKTRLDWNMLKDDGQ